jgi:hypothetical protein
LATTILKPKKKTKGDSEMRSYKITLAILLSTAALAQKPQPMPSPNPSGPTVTADFILSVNELVTASKWIGTAVTANGANITNAANAVSGALTQYKASPKLYGPALSTAVHNLRLSLARTPANAGGGAVTLIPIAIAGCDAVFVRIPASMSTIIPTTPAPAGFHAGTIPQQSGNTQAQNFNAAWDAAAKGTGAPSF